MTLRDLLTPLRVGISLFVPAEVERADRELRERVQKRGKKLTKIESAYLPATPLPLAWRYECQTCRYWEVSGPNGKPYPTCTIVGLDGDPFGGEAIHPLHWCALWLPVKDDRPLDWLKEWLDPSRTPKRGSL